MCQPSLSSASPNKALKWDQYMTTANTTHATIGCAITRMTRECRTGRIQRRRVSPEATRNSRVIGAAITSSGAATTINSRC
jgi:hypothetical protein